MRSIRLHLLLSVMCLSMTVPAWAYLQIPPDQTTEPTTEQVTTEQATTNEQATRKKQPRTSQATTTTKKQTTTAQATAKKQPIKEPASQNMRAKKYKKSIAKKKSLMTYISQPSVYMGVYGGYGTISGAYENDGQFTQGRLALGIRTSQYPRYSFGLETGVQWGNEMRLSATTPEIEETGGLLIQSTLKPLVDLLVTCRAQIHPAYPIYATLKGGIAYRQLQFMDRSSSQDNLRKVNAEAQAGLAYRLSKNAAVTLLYQGIYSGSDAGIHVNNDLGVLLTRIPTQQAGFLGLEYSI